MKDALTGILIGIGVGLIAGEVAIAVGEPFVVAHVFLLAGCVVAGAVIGYRMI